MVKKAVSLILACLIIFSVVGCSKEAKLEGSWAREGRNDVSFVFYSDGTCKIANEYGTGTWSITNGNQLKMVNYYGETEVATIAELTNSKLVITNGSSSITFVKVEQS